MKPLRKDLGEVGLLQGETRRGRRRTWQEVRVSRTRDGDDWGSYHGRWVRLFLVSLVRSDNEKVKLDGKDRQGEPERSSL